MYIVSRRLLLMTAGTFSKVDQAIYSFAASLKATRRMLSGTSADGGDDELRFSKAAEFSSPTRAGFSSAGPAGVSDHELTAPAPGGGRTGGAAGRPRPLGMAASLQAPFPFSDKVGEGTGTGGGYGRPMGGAGAGGGGLNGSGRSPAARPRSVEAGAVGAQGAAAPGSRRAVQAQQPGASASRTGL